MKRKRIMLLGGKWIELVRVLNKPDSKPDILYVFLCVESRLKTSQQMSMKAEKSTVRREEEEQSGVGWTLEENMGLGCV